MTTPYFANGQGLRSKFTVIRSTEDRLLIADDNNGGMTVTNDIENVTRHLLQSRQLKVGMEFGYFDSDNDITYVVFDDMGFKSFSLVPVHPEDQPLRRGRTIENAIVIAIAVTRSIDPSCYEVSDVASWAELFTDVELRCASITLKDRKQLTTAIDKYVTMIRMAYDAGVEEIGPDHLRLYATESLPGGKLHERKTKVRGQATEEAGGEIRDSDSAGSDT